MSDQLARDLGEVMGAMEGFSLSLVKLVGGIRGMVADGGKVIDDGGLVKKDDDGLPGVNGQGVVGSVKCVGDDADVELCRDDEVPVEGVVVVTDVVCESGGNGGVATVVELADGSESGASNGTTWADEVEADLVVNSAQVLGDKKCVVEGVTYSSVARMVAVKKPVLKRSLHGLVSGPRQQALRKFLHSRGVAVPGGARRDLAIASYTLRAMPGELLLGADRHRQLALVGDAAMRTVLYMRMSENARTNLTVVGDMNAHASDRLSNASLAKLGEQHGLFECVIAEESEQVGVSRAGATLVEAVAGVLAVHTTLANVEKYMCVLGVSA